jgi:hypothetical protein
MEYQDSIHRIQKPTSVAFCKQTPPGHYGDPAVGPEPPSPGFPRGSARPSPTLVPPCAQLFYGLGPHHGSS